MPYVWSLLGPVREDEVLPEWRVQSNWSPDLTWVKPQMFAVSKSQLVMLGVPAEVVEPAKNTEYSKRAGSQLVVWPIRIHAFMCWGGSTGSGRPGMICSDTDVGAMVGSEKTHLDAGDSSGSCKTQLDVRVPVEVVGMASYSDIDDSTWGNGTQHDTFRYWGCLLR